jgi:hypothetical protein
MRTAVEIEARSLGHDITWGVSTFVKAGLSTGADRQLIGEIASEFDEPFDPETGELLGPRPAEAGDDDAPPVDEDAA